MHPPSRWELQPRPLLVGTVFPFRLMFQIWMVVVAALLCEDTTNCWLVHFGWVTWMVREFCPGTAV